MIFLFWTFLLNLDRNGGTEMVDGFYLILNLIFIGGTEMVSFLSYYYLMKKLGVLNFVFIFLKNYPSQESNACTNYY
jgi:hypothetical protein